MSEKMLLDFSKIRAEKGKIGVIQIEPKLISPSSPVQFQFLKNRSCR
jgi:hypothetical protein